VDRLGERVFRVGVRDFPVDCGFPGNACSIRCSSMRCKHPFKKSISSVCWPIFRSNSVIRPSDQRRCPLPGKTLPGPCQNSRRQRCSTLGLTSKPRANSVIETPGSSRRTAANLNSLVNCLRDNPMTQFSIHWTLSLNQVVSFLGASPHLLHQLFRWCSLQFMTVHTGRVWWEHLISMAQSVCVRSHRLVKH